MARLTPNDPSRAPDAVGDEEYVPEDDAIIGRAFRWSIAVMAVVATIAGGVLIASRRGSGVEAPEVKELVPAKTQQFAATPPAVTFTDIAREAGIDFERSNGARGSKYLPETLGGGCAFFDADGDGDQDLFLVNGCPWPWDRRPGEDAPAMAFYRNDGQGRFQEASREVGLAAGFQGMGVAAGDYDNDGDADLFVTAVGTNHLYRNDGGRFEDVSLAAGVSGSADQFSTGAGFFDADNDADLDLMVCNYVVWSKEIDERVDYRLDGVGRAYGPPLNYEGAHLYFYRNDGGGRFTEVAAEIGMHASNRATGLPISKALAIAPCDVDRDGWMDVFVANDTTQKLLFRNLGNGRFEEIGEMAGVAYDSNGNATASMGIDTAEYRNDSTLAIAVGNFANEMISFYVAGKSPLRMTDEAIAEGVGGPSRLALKFGLFFFDYDLDGRLDLLHANGHLEDQIHKLAKSQHYEQPAQLYWNSGAEDSACMVHVHPSTLGDLPRPIVGRGAAYADIDGDGDLDVLITQPKGRPMLLRNDQKTGHHWLRLRLAGDGKRSNRDAIGARIEVDVAGTTLRRQVMPTRSYLSQVEPVVTFGLGKHAGADAVRIIWPDGTRQECGALPADRTTTIVQGS